MILLFLSLAKLCKGESSDDLALSSNIIWILLSCFEISLIALTIMSYPKKGYFVAYIFYINYTQYIYVTSSFLPTLHKALESNFHPFGLISNYPHNFIQNILDELIIRLSFLIVLYVKYRKLHENRTFLEFASLIFLSTVQNFLFYATENIKNVISSAVNLSEDMEIAGFVFAVLYILLISIYSGIVLSKFRSEYSICAIFKEDFPKSWIYYLSFSGILILTSILSSVMASYKFIDFQIFCLFDLALSKF